MNANDKVIDGTYGSWRLRAKGLNPYQRHPEREEYDEFETRERADGSTYRVKRSVYRWGGEFSFGSWQMVEQ